MAPTYSNGQEMVSVFFAIKSSFLFISLYLRCNLCRCPTGADPATNPTTLGSVAKVVGSCEKGRENAESVMKSPTGRYSYRS